MVRDNFVWLKRCAPKNFQIWLAGVISKILACFIQPLVMDSFCTFPDNSSSIMTQKKFEIFFFFRLSGVDKKWKLIIKSVAKIHMHKKIFDQKKIFLLSSQKIKKGQKICNKIKIYFAQLLHVGKTYDPRLPTFKQVILWFFEQNKNK